MVLFLTWLFRSTTCETFDEYTYLRLGVRIYRYGDFTSLSSPMVPPVPILLEYGLPALGAEFLPEGEGWEWEVPSLIRQARFATSILIGVPLVLLIYLWLSRRRGWVVGALGGGLVSFSPSILAASSIATTDACFTLFMVIALVVLRLYQNQPSRRSFLMVGAAFGLALAAKQSAVILIPVALLELVLKWPARRPEWTAVDLWLRRSWKIGTGVAGLVLLAFVVDWGLYGFGFAATFHDNKSHIFMPVIIPMVANLFSNPDAIMEVAGRFRPPLALDTFVGQMQHATEGHAAFLMGQHSTRGWWYFFPVALGLKSTPSELLMFGVVIVLACRASTWREPARRLWLGTALVLLGAGMCSSLNIGHRYMLPIYPLVVLVATDWLGSLSARWPVRVLAAGSLLLAWQAVSLAGIAPHYLAYFNSFCGGPSQGYRYLGDSCLDWGQDLPSLRRELEARNYRKVALCYFGTAKPRIYGLRSADWLDAKDVEASTCDWLAISVTSFQGIYGEVIGDSAGFNNLPSTLVSYSILLYDLKDPLVRQNWDRHRLSVRGRGVSEPRKR